VNFTFTFKQGREVFPVHTTKAYRGVDSASNRNEYQEYFLGVKAAGAQG